MDEEQGIASPIAGGLRGIRRSVSSSVFRPNMMQSPKPDPETTSLLQENSLSLQRVSTQLEAINGQVSTLGNSLNAVKENLALSDTLERQRERERQRREAILAEQGLREGKEGQIESKIQKALLSPVRVIAQKTQGILARLGRFLLILAGGWLTDKVLRFFTLQTQDNAEAMRKFKIDFLSNLLFFGGTLLLFKTGLGKILLGIKNIGAIVLKIGVSGLLTVGFRSAIAFVRNTLDKFRAFILGGGKIITKQVSRLTRYANYLRGTAFAKFFADAFTAVGKFITRTVPVFFGFKQGLPGAKFFKGSANFLRKIPYINTIVNTLFFGADFLERKDKGQTTVQAGLGAGAETAGFIAAGAAGLKAGAVIGTFLGGPVGTAVGGIIGAGLAILGSLKLPGLFGGIMDKLTGADKVDPSKTKKENTEETGEKKKGFFSFLGFGKKEEKVVNAEDNFVATSTDDILNNVIPNRKDEDRANAISNLNNNPEITTISMNAFNNARQEIASSSKSNTKRSLNISAEDNNNPYVAIAEAEFNMF